MTPPLPDFGRFIILIEGNNFYQRFATSNSM
jgi:hypothetical protein